MQAASADPPTKTPVLTEITWLRGVAILLVIFTHIPAIGMPPDRRENFIALFVDILCHDVTLIFAFISGLLYSHRLHKLGPVRYYKTRLLHVALPYLIATAILTWYAAPLWLPPGGGIIESARAYSWVVRHNLPTGGAWYHLWYIPVTLCLYALSPLFLALVRSQPPWRWLVFVLMALPFVITRVETAAATLVTWKTIVYFAGAYVIGVFAGLRYEAFLSWISAVKWPLAIVLILSTALLWPLSLQDSDQWHGIALRESLFYAQKLSLGGLILLQLRAWVTSSRPGWVSPLLGGVADVSYPLYFYHAAISLVVAAVLQQFAPAHSTYLFAVPAFILGFIGTTALTWAAILIIKAPLGRASKYILGAA